MLCALCMILYFGLRAKRNSLSSDQRLEKHNNQQIGYIYNVVGNICGKYKSHSEQILELEIMFDLFSLQGKDLPLKAE